MPAAYQLPICARQGSSVEMQVLGSGSLRISADHVAADEMANYPSK